MLMPEEEQTTYICKWNRKTEAGGQVAKPATHLARAGWPEFSLDWGHQRLPNAQLHSGQSFLYKKMLVKDKKRDVQENTHEHRIC